MTISKASVVTTACIAALAAAVAHPGHAVAATHSEVVNGATCQGYPPYQTSVAVPYQHWLYGFSQTASCQLTMTSDWPVTQLNYVVFTGTVSGGTLTAKLCVHSGGTGVTCGPAKTLTAGQTVNWVAPPSPLPSQAAGAFVQFSFPAGNVSTIDEIIPSWSH